MQKKILICMLVIFTTSMVLLSGYYLFVFLEREKQELTGQAQESVRFNDFQNEFIDTEMQETEVLVPIRNNDFLIDGEIASIDKSKTTTEIIVLINMDSNFKNSPIPKLARTFLVKESTVFFVSDLSRINQSILSGGVSRLEKGDLVAVETENSIEDILNQETFFIIKLWKIIK